MLLRMACKVQALANKLNEHQTALFEQGYLIQRTFFTSNAVSVVSARVGRNQRQMISRASRKFACIDHNWWEPHVVTVIGRVEDMPKWEETIRKMDFP